MILIWDVWEDLKNHIFQNAPGDSKEPPGLTSTDPDGRTVWNTSTQHDLLKRRLC